MSQVPVGQHNSALPPDAQSTQGFKLQVEAAPRSRGDRQSSKAAATTTWKVMVTQKLLNRPVVCVK